MAKRTRRWKVVIYKGDQPAKIYEIADLIRADAEAQGWERFGDVDPRDPRYRATVEEL
jgi:hypothetical protein